MARKPQTKKAEASAEAKPATPDLMDEIRRFKDPRDRMSAYDMVMLAERLGIEQKQARGLTYDRLRKAIRDAIRAQRGYG